MGKINATLLIQQNSCLHCKGSEEEKFAPSTALTCGKKSLHIHKKRSNEDNDGSGKRDPNSTVFVPCVDVSYIPTGQLHFIAEQRCVSIFVCVHKNKTLQVQRPVLISAAEKS